MCWDTMKQFVSPELVHELAFIHHLVKSSKRIATRLKIFLEWVLQILLPAKL